MMKLNLLFGALVALALVQSVTSYRSSFPRFPSPSSSSSRLQQSAAASSSVPYKQLFFEQYLDHFDLASQPQTYQQRYLINTDYWNGSPNSNSTCPGPIFFYTGNESPVTDYWDNSGFITKVLAPKYKAMILFAEHRYFGESLPFGKSSFDYGKISYLSAEQALADYAHLLTTLKREGFNGKAVDCPVVAFGGSYGGMLTAWFRKKYPNIVIGGLAASAPFAFVGTPNDPYTFMDSTQETYASASPSCPSTFQAGFQAILNAGNSHSGRTAISTAFKTCKPLESASDAFNLLAWLQSGLVDMCMLDYPYATDYGVNFPGWPVNTTCNSLMSKSTSGDLLGALAYAIQSFYNTTGDVSCLDINVDVPDWGAGPAWPYLACTELVFPFAQRGMWIPHVQWSLNDLIQSCKQQFNVTLRPYAALERFGAFDFQGSSNIIFSNGMLDPWHKLGITSSPSPSLTAIMIPESAHHLDLRGPNAADPIYVTKARATEDSIIGQWLAAYWN